MAKNSTISNLSDEELLILYKESDKNVYMGELFNRYLPLLYGVCLKYLGDSNKAQDAVLEFFDDVFYTISDHDIDTLRPWLYDSIKKYCSQILQGEKQFAAVDFNNNTMEFDNIMCLLEENNNVQNTLLMDCLNKLPERQRLSITYFFMDGLSYSEIMNKTGYTLKNVKNYIRSGKQNLKICIEKEDQ